MYRRTGASLEDCSEMSLRRSNCFLLKKQKMHCANASSHRTSAATSDHEQTIILCQHNILAPVWVTPQYSLLPCTEEFTSEKRINTTTKYLRSFDADIYCLCEVEERLLPVLDAAFPNYNRFFSDNEPGFWDEWLDEGEERVPNGTCVLVRDDVFSNCEGLTQPLGDGCVCCLVKCVHNTSGVTMLIASVHFDNGDRKWTEAEVLLSVLDGMRADVKIVSGDYNFTETSVFVERGYIEHTRKVDTTPLPQGMIDHTLLLSSNVVSGSASTGEGEVMQVRGDHGHGVVRDTVNDICATVRTNGSDHYATVTRVALT